MTYEETTKYLFSQLPMFEREGASGYKPGLERVEVLLELCGSPQNELMALHIAGTNGKGSISTMLAAILAESGLRVGLFTSPHLVDFRERIRVNGEMISEQYVIDFTSDIRPRIPEGLAPTFFELTTAMAFAYFVEQEVDIAVIEVGMGGRLDSTNVLKPLISVITNVSVDHAAYLGGTLGAIAGEKAGIIKPETPVVLGRSRETEVLEVMQAKAEELHAPLVVADRAGEILMYVEVEEGFRVVTNHFDTIALPLHGSYQIENFATVLEVVKLLNAKGFEIDHEVINSGLKRLKDFGLRGRLEVLRKENPQVIIDTGHNPGAWEYLAEQLAEWRREDKLLCIIGMASDKDVLSVLRMLPKSASYIFCQAHSDRAEKAEELLEIARSEGIGEAEVISDVKQAYQVAISRAQRDSIPRVFVGGSNYIIGELLS